MVENTVLRTFPTRILQSLVPATLNVRREIFVNLLIWDSIDVRLGRGRETCVLRRIRRVGCLEMYDAYPASVEAVMSILSSLHAIITREYQLIAS